jgi:hypothetical protein
MLQSGHQKEKSGAHKVMILDTSMYLHLKFPRRINVEGNCDIRLAVCKGCWYFWQEINVAEST